MKHSNDDLGNRMKDYERVTAGQQLIPLLPVMARLDGKCFSNFTQGLKRPYDLRMSDLMVFVTKKLVEEYNALIGYTQSDEITLVLYSDTTRSQIPYNGKIQKLVGDMAAYCSLIFNRALPDYIPEKAHQLPRFDCRVWNVPNRVEATNAVLWREKDATKNSVSMAARSYYSHKEIDGKVSSEIMDMMMAKGMNWNDYPPFFKRGTFIRREKTSETFTAEELEKLPEKHQARTNPELVVDRSVIKRIEMPSFSRVTNRVEVIFKGEDPIVASEE